MKRPAKTLTEARKRIRKALHRAWANRKRARGRSLLVESMDYKNGYVAGLESAARMLGVMDEEKQGDL